MIFKLLFITTLCLVSGFAQENQSPSFTTQFTQRCDAKLSQYLTENLSLRTSLSEHKAQGILQENEKDVLPEETQTSFFGSIASFAQKSFDSAKEKLKKIPNVLSKQANAIGTRAKNLPNVLSKEASKASRTIGQLTQKVSGGIGDFVTTPAALTSKKEISPNVTQITLPEAVVVKELTETSSKKTILKLESNASQAKQEKLSQASGIFENLKRSVKGISKATFDKMGKLKGKISQTPSQIMNKLPSVKVVPDYISTALGAMSNKAKKSTKDVSTMLNHLGKRLKQIPQNVTRVLQGTAQMMKNAISSNLDTIGSKIQAVPHQVSEAYYNFTKKVNGTKLIQGKDMIGKKIQALPEKLGKTFNYIADQVKKVIPDSLARTPGAFSSKISEGLSKFKQKVNATSISKAINTFTSKVTGLPVKVGKSLTFAYQNMKQRISSLVSNGVQAVKEKTANLPSLSEGAESLMNGVRKVVGPIGSFFTRAKDGIQTFIFGFGRGIYKLWTFISSLRTIVYWALFIILGAVFLYFMSQVLPIISFIISIIRTPLDILSLGISIIKSLISKKEQPPKQKKKTPKTPREEPRVPRVDQYYSYYRCRTCKKEWESSNTTENESKRCLNDDCCQEEVRPYHQIQLLSEKDKPDFSNRQVFFSYYNCPDCKDKWETPKALENEAQDCKTPKCSKKVLPYHQIQLLNTNNQFDSNE